MCSQGHTDIVRSVAAHPDGKRVLSGGHDKTLRLWRVDDGTCESVMQVRTLSVMMCAPGHRGHAVTCVALWGLWVIWAGFA